MDERDQHARAACADRVAKGHAAAADVQLLVRDSEWRDIRQDLGCKRLVHLKEIDVRDRLASLL